MRRAVYKQSQRLRTKRLLFQNGVIRAEQLTLWPQQCGQRQRTKHYYGNFEMRCRRQNVKRYTACALNTVFVLHTTCTSGVFPLLIANTAYRM
jgi:hypothetical protein